LTHTSVDEPNPRSIALPWLEWPRRVRREVLLAAPGISASTPFVDVLDARQSARSFTLPSTARLAEFLWHGARARDAHGGRLGLPWEHHAAPSAGGLHPITIVLSTCDPAEVAAYDPVRHALRELDIEDVAAFNNFHRTVSSILPEAQGTVLTLIANPAKTQAGYENGESLIWRDAGCLLATLQLCAIFTGLGYCNLGLLGTELLPVLPDAGALTAVGSAVVGEAMTADDQTS
jgi:hypothetical protein